MITWQDFEKIAIHTGTIIDVQDFPEARNPSYKLTIDFGEQGIKKSSAQLTTLYSKEELFNKQIIAVLNFPVKQIANFFSECLVLGAIGENNAVTLLQTERAIKNGSRIA